MSKALATKNVAAVLLGLGMIVSAFAFATPAKAQTIADLQAQINALLAQIAALQGGSSTGGSASCTTTFTQNLEMGDTGSEVLALQKFLNSSSDTQLAATGAGSPGNETTYFGSITRAGVIKFQEKYAADVLTPVGLSRGTGYWGPSSRAKANALCAATPGTPGTPGTPTTPGTLNVVSTAQPANSLAPENASRVPFTNFTLTNTSNAAVTINGVTVQRTGLANDAVFSGVVLVDSNGQQVGVARTFNSNHQATIGDTFTINPGQSMTFTVAGNMSSSLDSYAGQVVGISVVGINTTGTVSGSLPITGASQTVNATLSVGTVTANTSSLDPAAAQTKSIGDTGVRFSAVRLTAGSVEDVKLFSIRFRMNGSASISDLGNVMVVVNGTSYPTTFSADGRYASATFPGGIHIQKGNSVDVVIQGDLVGANAAGRIVEFDIDKSSDIYLVGQTYGYGITPSATANGAPYTTSTHASQYTNSQPWFQGATISIQGGTGTTIQNATSVSAQNIAVNVPNQPLGGFTTNFAGEPVTVQQMVFSVSTSSSPAGSQLTNVTIVNSNGAVVAGPVDMNLAAKTITFTDSVTFPTGSATYTIRGTVSTGAANGATYQLTTTPSSQWTNVTGQLTGNTVSLSGFGQVTMNTMTVQGLSLAIAMSSTPASQTIVAGGQNVLFANVQLDASNSGEDVRVNQLVVDLDTGGSSALSNISGCQIYDGSTALNYGSNIVNTVASSSDNTFTFNNSLTVPKGTVKTLPIRCNVVSGAAGTYTFNFSGDEQTTVYGTNSGNSSTITASASNSGTMTVGSSSLTASVDASSPSYKLAAGGTNGVTVGVYKFRPASEAMTLQEIGVKREAGDAGSVSQLYFYNSAGTQIGTAVFTGSSQYATTTLSGAGLTLAADTDTMVTVKADLSDIGTGQAGTDGDLVQIDPSGAKAVGQASGTTQITGASGNVSGVRVYNTYPTVAQDSLPSTGVVDGRLLRFKVTADSHGSLGLGKFVFTISTTTANVDNVALYGYSDASYSQAISSGAGTGGQIGNTISPTTTSATFVIGPNSSAIQVPAGQTYYFELRGTVSGVQSGSTVVTTLKGDGSPSPSDGTSAFSAVSGNFIWSPNATGTAATTSGNNWTNGYAVPGLSSSGVIQARSN